MPGGNEGVGGGGHQWRVGRGSHPRTQGAIWACAGARAQDSSNATALTWLGWGTLKQVGEPGAQDAAKLRGRKKCVYWGGEVGLTHSTATTLIQPRQRRRGTHRRPGPIAIPTYTHQHNTHLEGVPPRAQPGRPAEARTPPQHRPQEARVGGQTPQTPQRHWPRATPRRGRRVEALGPAGVWTAPRGRRARPQSPHRTSLRPGTRGHGPRAHQAVPRHLESRPDWAAPRQAQRDPRQEAAGAAPGW